MVVCLDAVRRTKGHHHSSVTVTLIAHCVRPFQGSAATAQGICKRRGKQALVLRTRRIVFKVMFICVYDEDYCLMKGPLSSLAFRNGTIKGRAPVGTRVLVESRAAAESALKSPNY